jgi:hypothetical protein
MQHSRWYASIRSAELTTTPLRRLGFGCPVSSSYQPFGGGQGTPQPAKVSFVQPPLVVLASSTSVLVGLLIIPPVYQLETPDPVRPVRRSEGRPVCYTGIIIN